MKPMGTDETASTTLVTPLGTLALAASPRGLRRIDFLAPRQGRRGQRNPALPSSPLTREARQHLARAVGQLREYFAGRRTAFDLPLDLEGTAHQRRVWRALLGIPFGRTLSYGALARRLGSPRAARAVGRACSTNPVPVVVPCHRVVAGNGALQGYEGGVWRKRALLELECSKGR